MYWRLSGFYFFYFTMLGGMLPYWSLYLEGLGLSYIQIASLMATLQITKVFAPSVWGVLGDRTGQRVRLVRLGSFGAMLAFGGVFFTQSFGGLMVVMLVFTFFWNAVMPQFEVLTLFNLNERRSRYAQVRLWGSVGFIVAVLGVGAFLPREQIGLLPVILAVCFVLIWLSSLSPMNQPPRAPSATPEGIRAIILSAPVASFLVMNFLLQFAHGPYNTFYSIYLEKQGFSRAMVGVLWSLGVIAEVVLFVVIHRLLKSCSLRSIALVALSLTVARWVLIAVCSDHLAWLVVAQGLHAASFGAMHVMSIHFIYAHFCGGYEGRGQALYSGVSYGLGGGLGAYASGVVYEYVGGEACWLMAALASLLALLVAWRWLRPRREASFAL